jgi:hypothetical protein
MKFPFSAIKGGNAKQPLSPLPQPSPPSPPSPPQPPILDSFQQLPSTLKLFITGSTIGPIVDSLHNQCLLQYDRAPINIPMPTLPSSLSSLSSSIGASIGTDISTDVSTDVSTSITNDYLFCSSWYIPLLLGIAYVVLGLILPNIMEYIVQQIMTISDNDVSDASDKSSTDEKMTNAKKRLQRRNGINTNDTNKNANTNTNSNNNDNVTFLRKRAILAVTTTALIIKLSDLLQTHPDFISSYFQFDTIDIDIDIMNNSNSNSNSNNNNNIDNAKINLTIMIIAASTQWLLLDGTLPSLLSAILVSIGGPLSELPFVATGFWHYIPSAADYVPLANVNLDIRIQEYKDLALSSITGPCYFAVTMDAIALGRWFQCSSSSIDSDIDSNSDNSSGP